MGRTKIEWTRNEDGTLGRNWNVTRGCSRISPGCENCYAERIAERFCDGPGETLIGGEVSEPRRVPAQPFHTFAERGKGWTRKVALLPEMLAEPLRWRKPTRVFVCSTSDLFHEALPDSAIDEVLAVMLVAPAHTFQVLTKRAARMRAYFADPGLYDRVLRAAGPLRVTFPDTFGVGISNPSVRLPPWIWLGVSVEDQKNADARIPDLLATPAAVRWVSYEPAIGPVDWFPWMHRVPGVLYPERLDWLVIGGESGPGARPFDLAWAREAIRRGREEGVPCFVKQIGDNVRGDTRTVPDLHTGKPLHLFVRRWILDDGTEWVPPIIGAHASERPINAVGFRPMDAKGGTPDQWPEDLRVRHFPEVRHG